MADLRRLRSLKHVLWINSPWRLTRVAWQLRRHTWSRDLQVHRTARFEGRGAVLGSDVRILADCTIIGPSTIENDVFLNQGVFIDREVRVGSGCSVGPFVRLLSQTHSIGPAEHRAGDWVVKGVEIGAGVWIGAGVTVLPGVRVGSGAVVGAGSLVTQDVPDNVLIHGAPARVVREL